MLGSKVLRNTFKFYSLENIIAYLGWFSKFRFRGFCLLNRHKMLQNKIYGQARSNTRVF